MTPWYCSYNSTFCFKIYNVLINNVINYFISTTLRGYTSYIKDVELLDIEFIKKLSSLGFEKILGKGGYSSHDDYEEAMR